MLPWAHRGICSPTPALVDGFPLNLSDSKSPQISRTLLSILADLNNAVVWMVSTCPLISKSSCSTPLIIGRTFISLLHSFFQFSKMVQVVISLFLFLWSVGTAKSTIWHVLFFFLLLLLSITRSGRLAEIRWSVCISLIIIIIIIYALEFFTSASADGLSLEFEWQ